MTNDYLTGYAEIVDLSQFEPGSGDGFIICVFDAQNYPETKWRIEEDSTQTERAIGEEVLWPPGTFSITFTTPGGGAPPPRLEGVTVRPGLGTVIIVSYS
jgi:hypothetical protein